MVNNTIQAVLDYKYGNAERMWQYDYGQILRLQGKNLPKAVEVHFSLNETGGDAITKVGVTTDGVAEVQVPVLFHTKTHGCVYNNVQQHFLKCKKEAVKPPRKDSKISFPIL